MTKGSQIPTHLASLGPNSSRGKKKDPPQPHPPLPNPFILSQPHPPSPNPSSTPESFHPPLNPIIHAGNPILHPQITSSNPKLHHPLQTLSSPSQPPPPSLNPIVHSQTPSSTPQILSSSSQTDHSRRQSHHPPPDSTILPKPHHPLQTLSSFSQSHHPTPKPIIHPQRPPCLPPVFHGGYSARPSTTHDTPQPHSRANRPRSNEERGSRARAAFSPSDLTVPFSRGWG